MPIARFAERGVRQGLTIACLLRHMPWGLRLSIVLRLLSRRDWPGEMPCKGVSSGYRGLNGVRLLCGVMLRFTHDMG